MENREEIINTVLNYVEGWYTSDSKRADVLTIQMR